MLNTTSSNAAPTRLAEGSGWWALAFLILVADQATKYAVHTGLPYGASIPYTAFFNLVHLWNTGAAFSFLADAGGWQRYFLSATALVISVVLAWMLTSPRVKTEATGYSLVLGGALGNVVDRIHRGYVVDFLDFHWQNMHWPAFNIADISIFIGVMLLILTSFRSNANTQALQR